MQCETKTHKIHTNTDKSTYSEMGPVWQNPIQRTVRTAHLCVLMIVHSLSTQYNTEQFWWSPLLPPDKHHSSDVVYRRPHFETCNKCLFIQLISCCHYWCVTYVLNKCWRCHILQSIDVCHRQHAAEIVAGFPRLLEFTCGST